MNIRDFVEPDGPRVPPEPVNFSMEPAPRKPSEAEVLDRLRTQHHILLDALRKIYQQKPAKHPPGDRPPTNASTTEWERFGYQSSRWETGELARTALMLAGADPDRKPGE